MRNCCISSKSRHPCSLPLAAPEGWMRAPLLSFTSNELCQRAFLSAVLFWGVSIYPLSAAGLFWWSRTLRLRTGKTSCRCSSQSLLAIQKWRSGNSSLSETQIFHRCLPKAGHPGEKATTDIMSPIGVVTPSSTFPLQIRLFKCTSLFKTVWSILWSVKNCYCNVAIICV